MSRKAQKIFISSSHSDAEFTRQIVVSLKDAGLDCWEDTSISPGDNWSDAIQSAMSEATVFVFVVTPDFVASDWSAFEMGVALGRSEEGVRIIPIIARDTVVPP